MDKMQRVTLEDMLAAREARAARIAQAVTATSLPIVSFTMNIPGPVKDSPLIRRGFREGSRRLERAAAADGLTVCPLYQSEGLTGCEALYTVDGDSTAVKKLCVAIEDQDALSRLFDMDVITGTSSAISRTALGFPERGCIVCGAPGRGCASRRIHSVEELQKETVRRLTEFFCRTDRDLISALATESLLAEVNVTPKPGLVDRRNSGSHRDMDHTLFEKSAAALAPFWGTCFTTGRKTAECSPEETFRQLRTVGLEAEQIMFAATNGVNTHKGAIFLLGTLCGAVGRLWDIDGERPDSERLLAECEKMTASAMNAEFDRIRQQGPRTTGERFYLSLGLRGARGEAADGLPGVRNIALPSLKKLLAAGYSEEHAAAVTLLHLIALGTDTNLFHRGGAEGALWAAQEARKLIGNDRVPALEEIEELDHRFIRRNLSPGGCADLLAVTLFLHRWESEK